MMPALVSAQEITENCESYIHQKAIADSAVGTMNGSSTMARRKALNGRLLLSSSASHRPSANFTILATMV